MPNPSSVHHPVLSYCKQAPEAAAMLLIECGTSAVNALHNIKAKDNSLEADVSILHTYALEGPDCAHEVALMCTEVCSCRYSAVWPLSLARWAGDALRPAESVVSNADMNS